MNRISATNIKNTTASFPRRRESRQLNIPRSGQNLVVSLRDNQSIHWIPACAGMTELAMCND